MIQKDTLQAVRDDIATTESMLDQAQAHFDTFKHTWTPEYAWQVQADIDRKRYHLAVNKLLIAMLENL